jgi:hypothetical protein
MVGFFTKALAEEVTVPTGCTIKEDLFRISKI